MTRYEAPNFRNKQRNCHNCKSAQFVCGGDHYGCLKYELMFDSTLESSEYVCDDWSEDK
jgi:hypothetical protein